MLKLAVDVNQSLEGFSFQIGDEVVDLGPAIAAQKSGEKKTLRYRVAGPRDSRTCAICTPLIGETYPASSPIVQRLKSGGMHPLCRHYVVPISPVLGAVPAVKKPGMDWLTELSSKAIFDTGQKQTRAVSRLTKIYGKARTRAIVEDATPIMDLYREDGTLKTLDELGLPVDYGRRWKHGRSNTARGNVRKRAGRTARADGN